MDITPQNEFTTTIPVIDDGDICGNAEHRATAQALANRTEHNKSRLDAVEPNVVSQQTQIVALGNDLNAAETGIASLSASVSAQDARVSALEASRLYSFAPTPVDGCSDNEWERVIAGTVPRWRQHTTASSFDYLFVPLSGLPFSGQIDSVRMRIYPGTGRAGLPALMPQISLVYQPLGGGSLVVVASANDSSASVGAYEVVHDVAATFAHSILAGTGYFVRIRGEGSTNSQVGLQVAVCTVGMRPYTS